jgi:cell division protein FtsL
MKGVNMDLSQKAKELQNEILTINDQIQFTNKRIAELKSLLDEKAKRQKLLDEAKAKEAELMQLLGL